MFDLFGDPGLRLAPDHRQLISKIGVLRLEPIRQLDRRHAQLVGDYIAGVDIHHFRRFHGSVNQVFVRGIERVVDLEILGSAEDGAGYVDVAVEVSGKTCDSYSANAAGCVDAVTTWPAAALWGESAVEVTSIAGIVGLSIADAVTADPIES